MAQRNHPCMYSKCCVFIYLLYCTDKYWRDAHNRRKFFIEFASQKGFDPLVPTNWENVQRREMIKQVKRKKIQIEQKRKMERDRDFKIYKVGHGPLHLYKHNFQKAVADSFPEIGVHIYLLLFLFPF